MVGFILVLRIQVERVVIQIKLCVKWNTLTYIRIRIAQHYQHYTSICPSQ